MSTLGDFSRTLLEEGRVVLSGRPESSEADRSAATVILEAAFAAHRLDVAGPPIPFDPVAAVRAAELLRLASWALLSRNEPVAELQRILISPKPPRSAAEHLSADLVFRFLPRVQRRAVSIAPDDWLAGFLADVLRDWPLSGVASDLEQGPRSIGDLGNHPGLWQLYAERLARHERPGWMPQGPIFDHIALVFAAQGRGRSPLLATLPEPERATLG